MVDEYKIFVGNIPFDSLNREFVECFNKLDNFISAEIIRGRGFGFVSFSSLNQRNKTLQDNNFFIGNRKLRLSAYDEESKQTKSASLIIKIENINKDVTRDQIYNEFSIFCPVGKCFIDSNRISGERLTTGIVEIFDIDIYNQLINVETLLMPNQTEITLKSYSSNTPVYCNNVPKKNYNKFYNSYTN